MSDLYKTETNSKHKTVYKTNHRISKLKKIFYIIMSLYLQNSVSYL